MGLCQESGFPRRPITLSLVVSVLLCVCLYEAQCASVPSVYNRSQFSHRRYDQTSLPNAKEQFTNAFKETIGDVRSNLKKHADNFDAFFRELLKLSHHNFHTMYLETYGFLYERNSAIFNGMFRDLELYYTTGSVDLTQKLKQFFSLLYKKMFEELNTQYIFDAKYLNCTDKYMEEMMPFGELPQKLIHQIKRAFVAIRTFVQALKYGNEVLRTIMEVPFTSSCENRLRSISYCRNCAPAAPGTPPLCAETCATILGRACFSYSANLNREWNYYLSNIENLAHRLKTSFNIELAVKPINIQISEAIMTFQENGATISQRLFSKCGIPASRPHTHTQRITRDVYTYGSHVLPANKPTPAHPTSPHPSMEGLIGNILKDIKTYKNLWSQLSAKLCSQYSTVASNCSNQAARSGEPLNYRDKNNVEIINQQVSTLRLITNNVNNAYNGLDADLEDNLKKIESGNVSSSVDDEISGSGDDEIPREEDPDASGSGEEPFTQDPRMSESTEPSSSTSNGFFFPSSSSPSSADFGPSTRAPNGQKGSQEGAKPSAASSLTHAHWRPLVFALVLSSSYLWHTLPWLHFLQL